MSAWDFGEFLNRENPTQNAAPKSVNDLSESVRQRIIEMSEGGHAKTRSVAEFFAIPESWVELIIAENKPGTGN
jgi:hypothetical protein